MTSYRSNRGTVRIGKSCGSVPQTSESAADMKALRFNQTGSLSELMNWVEQLALRSDQAGQVDQLIWMDAEYRRLEADMQVRRVVTGHDEIGKSIIKTDEVLTAASRGEGAKIDRCEIWSTCGAAGPTRPECAVEREHDHLRIFHHQDGDLARRAHVGRPRRARLRRDRRRVHRQSLRHALRTRSFGTKTDG
jgi:hypothetical protein